MGDHLRRRLPPGMPSQLGPRDRGREKPEKRVNAWQATRIRSLALSRSDYHPFRIFRTTRTTSPSSVICIYGRWSPDPSSIPPHGSEALAFDRSSSIYPQVQPSPMCSCGICAPRERWAWAQTAGPTRAVIRKKRYEHDQKRLAWSARVARCRNGGKPTSSSAATAKAQHPLHHGR
jgi:hypothetical protein